MWKVTCLGLLLSASLVGCGGSSKKSHKKRAAKKSPAQVVESAKNFDYRLSGRWASECANADIIGLHSHKEETGFSPTGSFYRSETYFSGDACQKDNTSYTYFYQGEVKNLQGNTEANEIRDLDLKVTIQEITPKSEDFKNWLNIGSICGISNWEVDKPSDITGKPCNDWFLGSRDSIYDKYQIGDDDKLRFGNSTFFNKGSAGTRPDHIDDSYTLERNNDLTDLFR